MVFYKRGITEISMRRVRTLGNEMGSLFSNSSIFSWGIFIVLSVVMGITIVESITLACIIIGTLMGLMMFQVPSYVWVCICVLSVIFSRLFTGLFYMSSILDFSHFPLVLGAVFIAINTRNVSQPRIISYISRGIIALLFLSIISWAINGGEFLRPVLNWLVFCEPFLLIYALLRNPPDSRMTSVIWRVILIMAFIQIPIGLWQGFTLGWGDPMQGTFVNLGAGAHVIGIVALIGVIICIARGITEIVNDRKFLWFIGAFILFLVPIFSDAKQAIVAFIPALFLVIFTTSHIRMTNWLPLCIISIIILGITFYCYQPLLWITNLNLMYAGLLLKWDGISIVSSKMSTTAGAWIWGLGPGNTVSRVALLSIGGLVKSDSPVSLLGLQLSPITAEVLRLSTTGVGEYSSIWSGVSSWLALLGDIGLIGLGLYVWIAWKLWHAFGYVRSWETAVAKGVLLMIGLLGIIWAWLEEPSVTLTAALVIGLALLKVQQENHHFTKVLKGV